MITVALIITAIAVIIFCIFLAAATRIARASDYIGKTIAWWKNQEDEEYSYGICMSADDNGIHIRDAKGYWFFLRWTDSWLIVED